MNILNALRKEHARLENQIEKIAAAIAALSGRRTKKGRKMSAAARKKISATQKANWRKKKRAGK
jgi:hypothetical protein